MAHLLKHYPAVTAHGHNPFTHKTRLSFQVGRECYFFELMCEYDEMIPFLPQKELFLYFRH